jgi:hypothetical protein
MLDLHFKSMIVLMGLSDVLAVTSIRLTKFYSSHGMIIYEHISKGTGFP